MKLDEEERTVNDTFEGARGRPDVRLLCALPAEAEPLVRGLELKPVTAGGPGRTRLWSGHRQGVDLTLVSCGVGAAAAEAGVQARGQGQNRPPCAWLNVGIAGHRRHPLGTPLLAHKISRRDRETGHLYPMFPFTPPCSTVEVVTVAREEREYPGEAAYDMEAHPFFVAASRQTTPELIHCFKVVSDNPSKPTTTVTEARARALIGAHLQLVADLVCELAVLLRLPGPLTAADPEYRRLLQNWHFTETQKHQLRRLLQRLRAAAPGAEVAAGLLGMGPRTGREVIRFLQKRLADPVPGRKR